MPLAAGTRLGSYEVIAAIGAGGMGEVYRARDTRLKRDVAVKVLPDGFASDPERLARFHREAELLASLNHPNIAVVYGLEQAESITAIVMELIEGDSLSDIIARGPMPLPALLPLARQIVEALEAAHEKGVIHRDLKPANVKVTPDGKVKVLDFGLAAVAQDATGRNVNATHSPTLTLATQAGLIMGTAAYMSPEQATGAVADKRADVWAFGVVLWEMLTGRKLFEGETVSHTLAFVITKEPDWSALPANTPAPVLRLLRRCLEKDRKKRLPEIATARIEIDDVLNTPAIDASTALVPKGVSAPGWRALIPWAIAASALIALGVALALWAPWRNVSEPRSMRLTVDIGTDATLGVGGAPAANLALSSDGRLLAYVARGSSGSQQIFVRRLEQLQGTPLSGTDDARNPVFSPDGQSIAFFASAKLKKIAVTGGGAVPLCDALNGRGIAWSEDGTIIFTGNSTPGSGLLRISSAGGKPEALTTPTDGETLHRWPQSLMGGKAVLFTAAANAGAMEEANLVVQSVATGTRKVVWRGGYFGRYLPSGHLIYLQGGTLFAARFDIDRLELTEQPFPVVSGVSANGGGAQLAVSANGTLVYLPGEVAPNDVPIVWMDRSGKMTTLRSMPTNWSNPQFSPDGSRLAIDIATGSDTDIWIYDWARDAPQRLTFDASSEVKPVWSPDGRRIVFSSTRGEKSGLLNLHWQRADGTGQVQRLTESRNNQFAGSWHPSGKFLAFAEQNPQTAMDIMILPLDGDEVSGWKPGTPRPFVNSPADEREPMFSPDGRWLAYMSNDSGAVEIYVRPFPGREGLQMISAGGGFFPMWSRTKPEIFYGRNPNQQIMAVAYTTTGQSFRADKPRLWSTGQFQTRPRIRSFDVHPDGERIAVAPAPTLESAAKQNQVVFILNFFDELKRLGSVTR